MEEYDKPVKRPDWIAISLVAFVVLTILFMMIDDLDLNKESNALTQKRSVPTQTLREVY